MLGCGRGEGRCCRCGEVWGRCCRCGKYGVGVEECLWDECGDCGEVRENMLGCGEVWKSVWGAHTLFYTSPTLLPTLTRHLSPHSPNTSPPHPHFHLTRLSTFFRIHLTLSHTNSHPLTYNFLHTFPHLPPHPSPTLT